MPSQGPLAPTANSVDGGGMEWSSPDAIYVLDSYEAFVIGFPPNTEFTSEKLSALTFGFSIPTEATITGVLLHFVGRSAGIVSIPNVVIEEIQLEWKGSVMGTPTNSSTISTEDWTYDIGGSSSLFGAELTPPTVNASSFGFRFRVHSSITLLPTTVFVNYVEMTVYYTVAPLTSVIIMRRRRQLRG